MVTVIKGFSRQNNSKHSLMEFKIHNINKTDG